MDWQLSDAAWIRLREMKRAGMDAGQLYRQMEQVLNKSARRARYPASWQEMRHCRRALAHRGT